MRVAPFPSLEPGAWSLLVTVLLECLKKKPLTFVLAPSSEIDSTAANVLQVQAALALLTRRRLHQCEILLFFYYFFTFFSSLFG